MKNLGIVIAALAGVAAGAALGVLFAPRSGQDTRDQIKDFVKSHCPKMKKERLEALADQIAEEIRES
ncbi:MAG: YtxH domain-containing protein [Muribaculaceae bacterium]|nr:YtxH domain-containing protein [Muribaculaceae bacterium]